MRTLPLFPLLVLVACRPDAKESDDVGVLCTDTQRPLAMDEVTPLGFRAADVLALGGTQFAGWVSWGDAAESTLSMTVDTGATVVARYIDSVADVAEQEEACWDHVEIDVVVGMRTHDGRLDEALAGSLLAMDPTIATFRHDLSAPAGTLDLEDFVPEDEALGAPESLESTLEWTVTGPGASHGTITGTARWEAQDGTDGTASESQAYLDIASFSTEPPARR
jgi:hypothetical protein